MLIVLLQVARSDYGRHVHGPRAWIKMASSPQVWIKMKCSAEHRAESKGWYVRLYTAQDNFLHAPEANQWTYVSNKHTNLQQQLVLSSYILTIWIYIPTFPPKKEMDSSPAYTIAMSILTDVHHGHYNWPISSACGRRRTDIMHCCGR